MSDAAQDLDWTRDRSVARLTPILWRYLSESAQLLSPTTSLSTLPELEAVALQRLAACHVAVDRRTEQALIAAQLLLRKMPASMATERVELPGMVRGHVDWRRTMSVRVARADPTLFVCNQPDRRYDSGLGRLIKASLACIAGLAGLTGIQFGVPALSTVDALSSPQLSSRLGDRVELTSSVARTLLRDKKLRRVRSVPRSALRTLEDISRRHPETGALLWPIDAFLAITEERRPDRLREMLASQVFGPASDHELFELETGVALLSVLEERGYIIDGPVTLLPDAKVPFARLRHGVDLSFVWWQKNAWGALSLDPFLSRWHQTLVANNISGPSPLIPDFVLHRPTHNDVLLVEVKFSAVGSQRERDGLRDLLAYYSDLRPALPPSVTLRGVVVALDASGNPSHPGINLQVASQKSVHAVLGRILDAPATGSWTSPATGT